ncbi:MAG TPA: exopolysaccharide biosynthesis polyprenyl glycosylphosphotransferase [Solirubrobacteraceae bacterium]|jgi:exopolysaccharide biosynthesis polyprenyl glycosylphosphotransferase
MNGRMEVTRQSTDQALPFAGSQSALRERPHLRARRRWRHEGPPQTLLEGKGWNALRAVCDFVLLYAAVVLSLGGMRSVLHASANTLPLLALPPLAMIALYLKGLYRVRMRALILDGLVPLLSAVSVAAMAADTIGLLINGHASNPTDLIRTWIYALVAIGLGRALLALAQRHARIAGAIGKPVLIVGAGIVGAQVARRLESHPEYGLVPVGFLDDEPRAVAEVGGREVPVLGTVEEIDQIVSQEKVRNVIVAFSSVADARLARLIQRSHDLGIEVSVVPRMFDTINNRIAYDPVGGLPLLSFSAVDPKGLQFTVKHAFDRLFAGLLLLFTAPVLGAIALAVRLSSPGPVLYRQRRVGRDGRSFALYKFRSMRLDPVASGDGEDAADIGTLLGGDTAPGGVEGQDRRTTIGKLLRKTSLDELPQFFNVLRGEMSVVGPRPERPEFVDLFQQDVVRYEDRHRVRSGITGWAQVNGLRGQTSLAERVEMDNYYIAHWSLGLDLKIILLTALVVFHDAE